MSTQFKISGSLFASVAAVAFLAASPASAVLIQTQSLSPVTGSASVTATQTGGPGTTTTTNTGATIASGSFSQFNTNNGVLTGVKASIDGGRSETADLDASGGSTGSRRADGSGNNTNTTLSAPGISQSFGNIGISSFQCKPTGGTACPRSMGPVVTGTTGNGSTSNAVALSSYAGGGNVSVDLTGDLSATVVIEQSAEGGPNEEYQTATLLNTVAWTGSMTLEYDYLAHANPSFNSINDVNVLNIDFGTVLQNSSPAAQNFAITNLFATLLASDTVGLDLDLITGPNSPFSLTGSTFSNLLAGLTSGNFSVNFDTSGVGTFSDTILLSLSDADAGVGMGTYNLTVNLNGIVQAPTRGNVPEPASLALFATGLLAMGRLGSRKRRKTA